jgi:hypothetical protein
VCHMFLMNLKLNEYTYEYKSPKEITL